MDVLDYTRDVPRESLARRVINYSPTIVMALVLVIYPVCGGYLWTNLCIGYLGAWGFAPIAAVSFVTIVVFGIIIRRRPSRARYSSSFPEDPTELFIRYSCRIITVIAHMLSVTIALQCLIMVAVIIQRGESWWVVLSMLITFLGSLWYLRLFYFWYWRCRYESFVLAQNAEMYGNPVFVSIPIFKFCGHFVLLIAGHKYELRLDAGCGRPLFNDRPLQPDEEESICNTVRNHIVIVGWTRKEPRDIRIIFQRLADNFGAYHRIKNNCRHFLQFGCLDLLDVGARWDENMLLVGTDNFMLVPKTMIMMWRAMSRELFRFVWTRFWGPDWESDQVAVPPAYFRDLGDRETVYSDD
ncbi:hypothetical protein Hypma_001941 [Hypsizygus marmoreus]|uniref:Transmembrane protein n=1 Tax=Hypsizygus marmoreus TaxID=39966 RepID=A0A369J8X9_HYPMA|nr:hypothetical protein Hypma_001941 [Hypsizygus marmoreus]